MTQYYKYPRTPHVPWSLGATDDDKKLQSMTHFYGERIIVTEKMDGENYTLYNDHSHARSLDSANHSSRAWVKSFHNTFKHDIPENIRICGENLYATHSIHYDDLESYFYVFSIWEENVCLSWEDTELYLKLLNLNSVPIIYLGMYNENYIKSIDIGNTEGYVIRNVKSFKYEEFSQNIAKFVRKDHVQSDKHWMHSKIIPNKLKNTG